MSTMANKKIMDELGNLKNLSTAHHVTCCRPKRLMPRTKTCIAGLKVAGVGYGGVSELSQAIRSDTVSWAILRFEVGSGAFAMVKHIGVLCVGKDAPQVHGGRLRSRNEEVQNLLSAKNLTITINHGDELTTEAVWSKIQETFPGENLSITSVDEMKELYNKTLESQLKRRLEATLLLINNGSVDNVDNSGVVDLVVGGPNLCIDFPAKQVTRDFAGRPQLSVEGVMPEIKKAGGKFNWALLDPERDCKIWIAGDGALEEMIEYLDPCKVLFGILRVQFEVAGKPVVKHVWVHWSGQDVEYVKRGRSIAQLAYAQKIVSEYCPITMVKKVETRSELDISSLQAELAPLVCERITKERLSQFATNGTSTNPPLTAVQEDEPLPEVQEEEPMPDVQQDEPMPEVDDALANVFQAGGLYNWAIIEVDVGGLQ